VSGIISVSENTKQDLMKLYGVASEKIRVIYEGYDRERNFQFPISNFQINSNDQISNLQKNTKYEILNTKYLLFIGRIEQRKNIENIVKSFVILKEKYNIPHKLILAGRSGYGYENIQILISRLAKQIKNDIVELGYVDENKKWELLKMADVFVFPTLYEGFGIPILEAQSVGTAVVASDNSSVPEVAADSALLIDPSSPEEIAESINLLISDKNVKNAIIEKGLENVKRFSWEKCAKEIAEMLIRNK
jgi:glycosyltransferase involved in cell wall biosynthesis